MNPGVDPDAGMELKSTDSESDNNTGGGVEADQVGDMNFESDSQESNSSSDSDWDVSQVNTLSGSEIFKSEYEVAVESFVFLENRWLHETNMLQQQSLYKAVFEAEVAFAIEFDVYADLITGNQTVLSIAKDKTRNRMRTRLKNNRCIGLPVSGRAVKRKKRKQVPRSRVDPVTRQIVTWSSFLQLHSTTMHHDLLLLWRKLPRLRRAAKSRWWAGESLSWSRCVERYRDFYDMASLYTWYVELPRAD